MDEKVCEESSCEILFMRLFELRIIDYFSSDKIENGEESLGTAREKTV